MTDGANMEIYAHPFRSQPILRNRPVLKAQAAQAGTDVSRPQLQHQPPPAARIIPPSASEKSALAENRTARVVQVSSDRIKSSADAVRAARAPKAAPLRAYLVAGRTSQSRGLLLDLVV